MTTPWNRENDATIARLAEGLEVKWFKQWADECGGVLIDYPGDFLVTGPNREIPYRPVDAYLTDLPAAVRAAEAWRMKDPDYRNWSIQAGGMGDESIFACLVDSLAHKSWSNYQDDPLHSAALASALLSALGGEA